jgi:hypothetical protein
VQISRALILYKFREKIPADAMFIGLEESIGAYRRGMAEPPHRSQHIISGFPSLPQNAGLRAEKCLEVGRLCPIDVL